MVSALLAFILMPPGANAIKSRESLYNMMLYYTEGSEYIAKEAFSALGITTLGDYFNQTIVCVFINIVMFIVVFLAVLAFAINGMDYAWTFPLLRSGDSLLGLGLGVLRGMFALSLFFMLLPIVLTVLGQFEQIHRLVEDSSFAAFFYRSNFLLALIPGTRDLPLEDALCTWPTNGRIMRYWTPGTAPNTNAGGTRACCGPIPRPFGPWRSPRGRTPATSAPPRGAAICGYARRQMVGYRHLPHPER